MLSREEYQRRTRAFMLAAALIGAFLVGFGALAMSPVSSLAGVLALTAAACLHFSRRRDV